MAYGSVGRGVLYAFTRRYMRIAKVTTHCRSVFKSALMVRLIQVVYAFTINITLTHEHTYRIRRDDNDGKRQNVPTLICHGVYILYAADGYAHAIWWANVCTTNFDRYLSILLKATGAMNKLQEIKNYFYVSYIVHIPGVPF